MYTSIFNLLSNIFFSLGRKSLLSQTWSTKQEDTTATAVAGMVAASSRKSAAVPARCAWVGLLMFATLPAEDRAHTHIYGWIGRRQMPSASVSCGRKSYVVWSAPYPSYLQQCPGRLALVICVHTAGRQTP